MMTRQADIVVKSVRVGDVDDVHGTPCLDVGVLAQEFVEASLVLSRAFVEFSKLIVFLVDVTHRGIFPRAG
ncbi:hypothetical protein RB195_019254 [Necator americanus]|uniref:Uncharacterized protein n=1 Tax=Necator americanus TaxID=51031 RepID=A0ABR1CDC2_NECAM